MEKKHKGAHSELIASAWLLSKGYEVFRNISPHGQVDIVAIRNSEVLYIDVKSVPDMDSQTVWKPHSGFRNDVVILLVSGGKCKFYESPRELGESLCPHCGKSFKKRKSTQIYCTSAHGDEFVKNRWLRKRGIAPPEPLRVELICIGCGNPFIRNARKQKYCSRKCRHKKFLNDNDGYRIEYKRKREERLRPQLALDLRRMNGQDN